MSEIAEKVKAIIVEKLSVDAADVKDEASFTNDLGADSLETVELMMDKLFDVLLDSVCQYFILEEPIGSGVVAPTLFCTVL